MHPERHDIPASYELRPEQKAQEAEHAKIVRVGLAVAGIVAAAIIVTLGLSTIGLNNVSKLQTTQIHQLDQANARLAGELSAQSSQMSQLSARLAAADPASDSSLITCRDLHNLNLMATNGGSVSSVPGAVSLNQSAVPLPGHCKK